MLLPSNLHKKENSIMVKKLLKVLLSNLNVCSMDIVEYNPLLDIDNKCKNKIEEIQKEILEKAKKDHSRR